MTIDSFDIVFYTAIFVLPGFIIVSIIDIFNPCRKRSEGVLLLNCLLYSIVHCALWSWLYKLLFLLNKTHPYWYWLLLVIATVLGAVIIALIIGILKQKQLFRWIFSKLKIISVHSIPTAWDYCLSKADASWIVVTLQDDSKVYGLYSVGSFASSEPEERDLYIERIYSFNEENHVWGELESSQGVYIPKDQIKTIEFMKGSL